MNDKKKLLTDMFQYKELPMKNSPNILLFNIPCEGYGDVIFAFKLSSYLIEWYNAKITIATINTDAYSKLGLSSPNIKIHKLIKGITSSSKCRYLKGLSFVSNEVFDLIFVAPRTEKDPILSDVKSVIPYSNLFNTYFFSEYTTKYDWFIDKISDVEEYDIDKIEELYKEIFDELPVMRLHTDGSEIWLEYNKDTNIIFVDPKKSIRRDIILNNLFKDENYK